MSERVLPHVNVRMLSPNRSSRRGAKLTLITVHATQGRNITGLADLRGLGGWFGRPEAQVSSHTATDAEGHSGRYVRDSDKAWHCANYNAMSLGIEQVGFAEQTQWADAQLRETARWIAYWSRLYGIPIQKAEVSGGRVLRPGVLRHSDLGAAGGNHGDPGRAYPTADVLEYARHYRRRQ